MAHPTRGSTSHTFDIIEVLSVDPEHLSLTIRDAAHAAPQTFALRVRGLTPAAGQLFRGMQESLAVIGDGLWESSVTLDRMMSVVSQLINRLTLHDITDFSSLDVDLPKLREVLEDFDPNVKRTLNKLMGRVLRSNHPNGKQFASALQNTAYMVKESKMVLYEDLVVDAIKHAAQGVFNEVFKAQRTVFESLGYDVKGRTWLRISAQDVLKSIRSRFPELESANQFPLRSSHIEQIAWVLLHPEKFPLSNGRRRTPVLDGRVESLGIALYPTSTILTAAAILHCLAELSGLNLSVILRTEPSDLAHTGDRTGILKLAKAHNHSEDTLAVRTESNNTLGGLIEALTGLTRFSRDYRLRYFEKRDMVPLVTSRLYVVHISDPSDCKVISDQQLQQGWRSRAFDKYWQDDTIVRANVGLRFIALRRKVLERALDPEGDVHGHSNRTRVYYLQNVLPQHTLVTHATAAQDDIVKVAMERFSSVAEASDPEVQQLRKAIDVGETADLLVGVCTSGGKDPEVAELPCSLGLAACFTCPNGYRTVDHVPGLLALVSFTELIRNNDPDEWEHGDAAVLNFYAKGCLAEFPSSFVAQAHAQTDVQGQMAIISQLYTEFRR